MIADSCYGRGLLRADGHSGFALFLRPFAAEGTATKDCRSRSLDISQFSQNASRRGAVAELYPDAIRRWHPGIENRAAIREPPVDREHAIETDTTVSGRTLCVSEIVGAGQNKRKVLRYQPASKSSYMAPARPAD
jgi:hypothetical protein